MIISGSNFPKRTWEDSKFAESVSQYDESMRNFGISISRNEKENISDSINNFFLSQGINFKQQTIKNIQGLLTECFESDVYWNNLKNTGRTIINFTVQDQKTITAYGIPVPDTNKN